MPPSCRRNGADGDGHDGFIVHPRDPNFMHVDRDFVFVMNNYDIDPGSCAPKVMIMLDLTCGLPGIDNLVVRTGDRTREGSEPGAGGSAGCTATSTQPTRRNFASGDSSPSRKAEYP